MPENRLKNGHFEGILMKWCAFLELKSPPQPAVVCLFGSVHMLIELYVGDKEFMSNKHVVVSDVSREYDNPIAELVQVACQFKSEIHLEENSRKINAKSIMGIMAFNPSQGMSVNIVAEGNDEQEALAAMEKFLACI
jgi:phosphocarrier protein